ncbi:MAG: sugar transferase [Bacilli bacterium]|nr:sugar transferase [Bacilli bacterium]
MYKHFFKRLIDFVLSFIALSILLLPMIAIGIIIKCDSKGPAIFKQKRIGKNKKIFTIFKFRTMCNHAYEKGGIASSENDSRITKVGKFLRKTSIDEFPQLINILLGQMAIIGPRPILDWEYNEYAKDEYESRFDVRPGMFCTVDLDYRATASRDIQFKMDSEYAQNVKFSIDFKTFFGIVKTVITGKNVYKEEGKGDKND